MRITLRNLFLAPAVLAVATFAATSAHADATLKVPFSFKVGGKDCPAGDYVVSRDAKNSMVMLRSKAVAARTFVWLVSPGDAAPTASSVTLRFNEKGSNHELRSVQYGAMVTSRLDKTKHNEHVQVDTITGQ